MRRFNCWRHDGGQLTKGKRSKRAHSQRIWDTTRWRWDVTAAALLFYGDEPYRTVRDELLHDDRGALELATELADALPNGHEPSIAKTMLRSIRALESEGQDLLRLASVLAVAPIPASLVTDVFDAVGKLGRSNAERAQRKAFQQLTKASLADTAGNDARIVHALVSRTMRFREKSTPERIEALRFTAIEALRNRIASIPHAGEYRRIATEVPHARHLVANGDEGKAQGDHAAARKLARIFQCAPTAQITSGGRIHPCSCR